VEPDWVRFFVHITDPRSGQLIPPDKAQAVQHLPGVLGLLQYILVRDARLRPTLHDVQARCVDRGGRGGGGLLLIAVV
jgi:hypothetical protein